MFLTQKLIKSTIYYTMAIKQLNEYMPNKFDRDVQKHLYEAYQILTCSNGRYSDCDYHHAVWEEFNKFARKIFNNRIKK